MVAVAKGEWFGTEAVLTAVAEAEVADAEEAHQMAMASFEDLDGEVREKIALYSERRTLSRCVVAAEEMLTAAASLDADLTVDPEVVAVLAAGPACSRAASSTAGTIQ